MRKKLSDPSPGPEPLIVPRREHSISRSLIDPDALKILYRLTRHGHTAYLVGGSVRDLLLGRQPKDFDISTSAHPQEIKALFGNCRLIGRRFRLAHVFFRGGKTIEVATFRAVSEFGAEEDGLILSDNTFGTPWEDAFRRDFTVNALFYDVKNFTVLDYVGGLEDLGKGIIRCIGDPSVRFREDPIRMLRGIRFASLLGFDLDGESARLIRASGEEIWKGAMPRIFEEIVRMMDRGTAAKAFSLMENMGLLRVLFPEIEEHIQREGAFPYLDLLGRLDQLCIKGAEPGPWLILSCLFYPLFDAGMRSPSGKDFTHLAREVVAESGVRLEIPRKIQDRVRQVLAAQARLFALGSGRSRPGTLIRKSWFADAFGFFELAVAGSQSGNDLVSRWKELMGGDDRKPWEKEKTRRRKRRGARNRKPATAK